MTLIVIIVIGRSSGVGTMGGVVVSFDWLISSRVGRSFISRSIGGLGVVWLISLGRTSVVS